jgi:hypothetical protein
MTRWRHLVRDYKQQINIAHAIIFVAAESNRYEELLIREFPTGRLLENTNLSRSSYETSVAPLTLSTMSLR